MKREPKAAYRKISYYRNPESENQPGFPQADPGLALGFPEASPGAGLGLVQGLSEASLRLPGLCVESIQPECWVRREKWSINRPLCSSYAEFQ